MSNNKKVSLIIAVFVLSIATLAACFWLLWPRYEPLMANLSLEQSADVIKRLDEQNIEYELTDQGKGVQVLSDQLDTALVNLASSDSNQQSKGLELYETVDYSMTEHIQDVTYKRATQGELERTLEQFTFIKSARVHITFANTSLFAKQNKSAKASVFLVLQQAGKLSARQISAVQSLVATSVEDLSVEDVTVLDNEGGVLTSSDTLIQHEHATNSLDQNIENKVAKILALYFAPQQFAVTARVETSNDERKEVIQSVLSGAGQGAVLKEKRHYTQNLEKQAEQPTDRDEKVEIEYAHGKKVEEVLYRANRVKRISLAVAIQAQLNAEQTAKLKRLVSAAAGLNLSDGDNFSFEVLPPQQQSPATKAIAEFTNADIVPLQNLVSKEVEPTPVAQQVATTSLLPKFVMLLLVLAFTFTCVALVRARRTRSLNHHSRDEVLLEVNKWLRLDQEVK